MKLTAVISLLALFAAATIAREPVAQEFLPANNSVATMTICVEASPGSDYETNSSRLVGYEFFVGTQTGRYFAHKFFPFDAWAIPIFVVSNWHCAWPFFCATETVASNFIGTIISWTNTNNLVRFRTNYLQYSGMSQELFYMSSNTLPFGQISNGVFQLVWWGKSNHTYCIAAWPGRKGDRNLPLTWAGMDGPLSFSEWPTNKYRFYTITATR